MDITDDPVPRYTETAGASTNNDRHQEDEEDFFTRVSNAKNLSLPILASPPPGGRRGEQDPESERNDRLALDIIFSFFTSIEASRDELLREFVSRGLVSPDVKHMFGETPLLAAVRVRSLSTIHTLLSLGALVDEYGSSSAASEHWQPVYPQRTPLQLAAHMGYLAAVKVLMEEYGADDSLVAPDGQIALRLAAEGKHRDVVEYLPQRRGGAWLRWKAAHRREMKLVKKALSGLGQFVLFFIWELPKFFLYSMPVNVTRNIWEKRAKILPWIKKKVVEVPARVGALGKRAAKRVVKEIKEFPTLMKKLGDFLVRALKNTYKAIVVVCKYIARGVGKIGGALWELAKTIISLIHSTITAIITWFKTVTLKDIRDGCVYVLRTLFITVPLALVEFVKNFGQMSYDALNTVFGWLGKGIWWLGRGLLWLVTYIPAKIWQCMQAIGRLFQRGCMECLVYFDPKRI